MYHLSLRRIFLSSWQWWPHRTSPLLHLHEIVLCFYLYAEQPLYESLRKTVLDRYYTQKPLFSEWLFYTYYYISGSCSEGFIPPPHTTFTHNLPRCKTQHYNYYFLTTTTKKGRTISDSPLKRRLPTFPQLNAVSSALVSLTSLFGMGRGGTSLLSPPKSFFIHNLLCYGFSSTAGMRRKIFIESLSGN